MIANGGRSISEDREDTELVLQLDLSTLKAEVLSKAVECQSRGLTHSFKFLSELGYSLRNVERVLALPDLGPLKV